MAAREEGEDRVLTIPNVLSIGRLLCAPLFLWLLFGRENRAAAATLLGVLGVTDFVDGYIARHFNQVSRLGKVLDPVADRILLLVGVIGILIDGSVPVWVAVAALAREALLSLVVLTLAAMGARRIDVQWVGKAGTFALMVSFPLFLAGESTVSWADFGGNLAWAFAIPGLVLSYYAALIYVPMARRALAEGRLDRTSLRRPGTGPTGTGTGTEATGTAGTGSTTGTAGTGSTTGRAGTEATGTAGTGSTTGTAGTGSITGMAGTEATGTAGTGSTTGTAGTGSTTGTDATGTAVSA